VGSEGNCTSSMCCRPAAPSTGGSMPAITVPAPLYGYYKCDSPYYLALAAMQALGPLTGTSSQNPPAFSIYTGDLVAHDSQNQRSRAYVEYVEDTIWQMFKTYIGGPVYVALGVGTIPSKVWSYGADCLTRITTPTLTIKMFLMLLMTTVRSGSRCLGTTIMCLNFGSITDGSITRLQPTLRLTTLPTQ
jgi:hypothetical protein